MDGVLALPGVIVALTVLAIPVAVVVRHHHS